jgi:hypothetical protein
MTPMDGPDFGDNFRIRSINLKIRQTISSRFWAIRANFGQFGPFLGDFSSIIVIKISLSQNRHIFLAKIFQK